MSSSPEPPTPSPRDATDDADHPARVEALAKALRRSEKARALWDRARADIRAAWPALPWQDANFLSFLARRIPDSTSLETRLGQLRLPDLYLAFACLQGLPGAAEAFNALTGPILTRTLSSRVNTPGQVDDVRQAIYEKLFSGSSNAPPAITKYDGVGALGSWVRITAVRMVLNTHRSRRRERPLSPGVLLSRPDEHAGPEETYLKRLYSTAFKGAFEQALANLTPTQRNLLRYYYLEGLTVEQIGRLYGVHKATISRRLSDVRETLLTETRNRLVRRLEVGDHELESILRLIQSQMDASICRFLREP